MPRGRPKKKNKMPKVIAKIKVLNKTYEAIGNTPLEAISNLNPPKGRGISVLSVDGVSKVLDNFQTQRLFAKHKLTRELALKNLTQRF